MLLKNAPQWPKPDVDLISKRLKDAREEYERRYGSSKA